MRLLLTAFRRGLKWLAAGIAAACVALLITLFLPDDGSWPALAAGWGAAFLNALVARGINRRAMGTGRQAFLRWGVIGNVLRILALLGILIAVIFAHRAVRSSFFASFFAGLFVFMSVEITELFRLDPGKREMF
jgi:hypothetical protein